MSVGPFACWVGTRVPLVMDTLGSMITVLGVLVAGPRVGLPRRGAGETPRECCADGPVGILCRVQ